MPQPLARLATLAAVLLPFCFGTPAGAAVTLKAEVGWGGVYRAGRWGPILVTAADDSVATARNISIEVILAHSRSFGIRLHQQAAIGPKPTTFIVYAPLPAQRDSAAIVLRDVATGRKLGELSLDPGPLAVANPGGDSSPAIAANEFVIGISGQPGTIDWMGGRYQFGTEVGQAQPQVGADANALRRVKRVKVGYLSPNNLPDVPLGYETLDLLILNGPDLATLPIERQRAIADWVRAGGRLLLWLGDSPMPPDSPIAGILPCTSGEVRTLRLDEAGAARTGVSAQRQNLPVRTLVLAAHARTLPVLDGRAQWCRARCGLGDVAVLPFDATRLVFNDETGAKKFWQPILWSLLRVREDADDNSVENVFASHEDALRAPAVEAVAQRLGDVPGVGRFDFSYIALIVLAMMIVVGPLDWFVLRKLGRQPWTWATICGWVVLITVGGLYLGHAFRSGDLHFRTVRVVEQVGNRVVAAADVAGLYSPRTRGYQIKGQKGGWWQPLKLDSPYEWRTTGRFSEVIDLAQGREGNYPLEMPLRIWNLRFMQDEVADPSDEKPAIRADLKLRKTGAGKEIVGTVTNLSSATLTSVFIVTRDGYAVLRVQPTDGAGADRRAATIAPGESIEVHVAPTPFPGGRPTTPATSQLQWGDLSRVYRQNLPEIAFVRAACDLKVERSMQVDAVLEENPGLACIYAEGENAASTVTLADLAGMALEKHWLAVRALIELNEESK